MSLKRKHFIIILIITGFVIYFNNFFNGFVWDDEELINNITSHSVSAYFRPVSTIVYSSIYGLFGTHPFFFHFFQLSFHIISAVLIFILLGYFFKGILPFILSLIFLVHPGSVEAVSFISAMNDTMFVAIGLVGLLIFIENKNMSILKIFLTVVLFTTSLLAKETGIVFFLLAFVYLMIFRRKPISNLINYLLFSVIFIVSYITIRVAVGNLYVQGQGLFPIMRVSFLTRLLTMPKIIFYYLTQFAFPKNLAIAQNWVVTSPDIKNFFLPLIVEIIIFSAVCVYIYKNKDRLFLFFFLWFVIGLTPHLQIVPLNMTVAERWLYFPMIGLLGMIGVILSKFKYPVFLIITIISILSVRTFIRTFDWRNGLSLYSADIRLSSSFDLQNNYGVELFRKGEIDKAKKYFEISTRLAPYWWVNWNNLGAVYERKKDLATAEKYYKKSIDNGDYYLAYYNYAGVLIKENKLKSAREFLETKGLQKFPNDQTLKQWYMYIINNEQH